MPAKKKEIIVAGKDAEAILALAYGALEILGWMVERCTDNLLLGNTPRNWNKWDDEITIEAVDNGLTITSRMTQGSIDLLGKNKKHLSDFENIFEPLKSSATEQQVAEWKKKIASLKVPANGTKQLATQETTGAGKVIHSPSSTILVTYVLIAANILVFVIMGSNGVNVFAPSVQAIVQWGGNKADLTVNGEWWRLLTSCFVHIGFQHLLFNMYGLFFIGLFLEPLLGRIRFGVAYVCCGILSGLVSLWWHQDEPSVSAGASGAIFGMYGIFLGLLTTNIIPSAARNTLLQSIVIFVGYNLLMGLKEGVDNSAHIGGLISGLVIGYLYYFILRQQATVLKKEAVALLMLLGTLIVAVPVLKDVKANYQVKSEAQQINEFIEQIPLDSSATEEPVNVVHPNAVSYYVLRGIEENYSDTVSDAIALFKKELEEFLPVEETTVRIYDQPGNGTLKEYVNQLASLNKTWEKGIEDFSLVRFKKLPVQLKETVNDLIDYCHLYKQKTNLLIQFYQAKTSDQSHAYNSRLDRVNAELNSKTAKIKLSSWQVNE